MGRKKLEIKRIEDNSARMVCFSKRRNGLLKKAKELSVLCDVDVAAIIFSKRGKLFQYCSTDSMEQVLQQYQSQVESHEKGVCETEDQYSKDADYLTFGELLQTVGRELKEPHVDELSVADLVLMEKQLEIALKQTRSTKTQFMMDALASLKEKEKMLVEEKGHLKEIVEGNNNAKKKKMMIDLNIVADG